MKLETYDRLIMIGAFVVYLVLFGAWLRVAPDPNWGNIGLVFLAVPMVTVVIFYGLWWSLFLGILLSALYLPVIWPSLVVGKMSIVEVAMKFALVFAAAIGAELFRRYEIRKRNKLADLAERLEEKVEQQKAVIKAQQALGTDLDYRNQLQAFMRWGIHLVSAEAGYIMIYDRKKKEIEVILPEEPEKGDGEYRRSELPEPLKRISEIKPGKVTEDQVMELIDELNEHRHAMCVPLYVEKQIAGSLCLVGGEHHFTENDERLVGMLGEKAQVAIDNAWLHEKNTELFISSIVALAKIINARDPLTKDHSDRVARLASMLAQEHGMDDKDVAVMMQAGELHDIGRIIIPDHILKKPSSLTKDEYEIVKKHPETGYELLKGVTAFEEILPAVLNHHERFDGQGYPGGLKGSKIPLTARIISVADVFEALTSDRSHRGSITVEEALDVLREVAGKQLDPELVEVFCDAYTKHREKYAVEV